MTTLLCIVLYVILFTVFAVKQFKPALGLFIIALPTYLIRLNLGPLPSTFLEATFGALTLAWLIKYGQQGFKNIHRFIRSQPLFSCLFALFSIASVAGILISDQWYISLGQWRAYFLEPMIFFLMLGGMGNDLDPICLINPLIVSTFSISVFGILQRFTGWHIGNADTVALASGRITSLFLSPNDIGLFMAPIIPLIAYGLSKRDTFFKRYLIIGILALITLLLSQSFGTILGLAAGAVIALFLLNYKKTAIAIVILGCILSPIAYHLFPTKIQSTTNRTILWNYTGIFLTESPKNFVFGAGIRQFFRKVQKPYYYIGGPLERLIYPHNIFLNFWSEIGFFGMLSFAAILYFLFRVAFCTYKNTDRALGAALIACLTVFFIHGLVDVPYFKNDLAFAFWVLAGLVFAAATNKKTP